jgi:hypothetical protein
MNDFYRKLLLKQKNEHRFAQFFWTPSPCITDAPIVIRIGQLKAGTDIKDAELQLQRITPGEFGRLSEQDRVNFKQKMPMPELGLALSEELTVTKSKWRPAILIHRGCLNLRKESRFVAKLTGKPVEPNKHLFAPVYSLRKEDGSADYEESFITRVKDGVYPNIMHLPAYTTPIKNESMVVLSDLFQAGLHCVEATELCVDPEILGLKLLEWNDFLANEAAALADEFKAGN